MSSCKIPDEHLHANHQALSVDQAQQRGLALSLPMISTLSESIDAAIERGRPRRNRTAIGLAYGCQSRSSSAKVGMRGSTLAPTSGRPSPCVGEGSADCASSLPGSRGHAPVACAISTVLRRLACSTAAASVVIGHVQLLDPLLGMVGRLPFGPIISSMSGTRLLPSLPFVKSARGGDWARSRSSQSDWRRRDQAATRREFHTRSIADATITDRAEAEGAT